MERVTLTTMLTAAAIAALLIACPAAAQEAAQSSGDARARMSGEQTQGGQAGAALKVAQSEEFGAYLTDMEGQAVYMLESDPDNNSMCYDQCSRSWPPVLTPEQVASADPAIEEDLIGTIKRVDGIMQVTYNKHPLYYYVRDLGKGEATGQDVHDQWGEWYLLRPSGEPVSESETE